MSGTEERVGQGDWEGQDTLAKLFLAAMRKHDRAAVLLHHDGVKWRETPDWRLERQVIRLALLLRERARLAPGDRVAIVSALRPESVVAELAAIAQGAAAVAIDPDLPPADLRAAIDEVAPAVVFVAQAAAAEWASGSSVRAVVRFGGRADGAWAWSEALDLGGTLDTPERAQSFRAQAREVLADSRALGHLTTSDGLLRCEFLTHAEAVERIRALRAGLPARKRAVALVTAPPTLPARLAMLSFVVDGSTSCALGTEGPEVEGIRPDWVVGPAGVPESARPAAPAPQPPKRAGLLARVFSPFRSAPREPKLER
jgi:non-ribosomal peptide synthetase component F